MVSVALLAGGCAGPAESRPPAELSGRLDDSGVTVVAVLIAEPDGHQAVQATFTPQKPGYHLYSKDLPPGGVDGLGVPTTVLVGGGLRAVGSPTANAPVRTLQIAELGVDLPVYPDGPVTITMPVRRAESGPGEVIVTYAACSPSTCLAPVRNRVIALSPNGTRR